MSTSPRTVPPASRLREYIILGLLTLAPIAVTVWVLSSVISFLDRAFFAFVPVAAQPSSFLGVYVPGLGLLMTFLLVLLFGMMAKTFAGKLFQSLSDSFIGRVPVVRGLYSTAKQMSAVFFAGDSKSAFKRVVLVPFPSPHVRSLAFVTGTHSPTESVVYVPTAPNPTSGYVLIYGNDQLQDSPLDVEEALKVILSCGAVGKI